MKREPGREHPNPSLDLQTEGQRPFAVSRSDELALLSLYHALKHRTVGSKPKTPLQKLQSLS